MDLGQPEFSAASMKNDYSFRLQSLFQTLGFVFSNRYRKLEDARLNALIWAIRITFPLAFVLFPIAIFAAWLKGN
jgi:hypothetical protein